MSRPPKGADRWAQLNAFADAGCAEAGLSATAAVLWFYFFRHANADGVVEQVPAKRIATDMPLGRRTITNAIGELHKAGLLIVLQEGREDGTPAKYRIRPKNFDKKAPKPRRKRPGKAEGAAPDDGQPIALRAIAV